MITIWVKTDLVLSPVLSTVFSKTAASLAAAWKLYRVSPPSNPLPSNEKVSSCRCQSMNLWFQEYSTIATGMPKIIACSTPTLLCQQCFIIVVQRAVHTYCWRQRVGCISHMADVTSRKQTERETGIERKSCVSVFCLQKTCSSLPGFTYFLTLLLCNATLSVFLVPEPNQTAAETKKRLENSE